jgi:Subtilase family
VNLRTLLSLVVLLLLCGLARPAQAAENDTARQIMVMLPMPAPHFQPNASYAGSYGGQDGRSARVRLANRLAKSYRLAIVSEWPMPRLGVHCFVMEVAASDQPQDVAAKVTKEDGVSWSEPLHEFRGEASTAPDPLFSAQPAATQWRLAELHSVATGRNVRVAVVDSGIELTHPDLRGQVEVAKNFVTAPAAVENHGTSVAGVIAARDGNGLGISGVAPEARLLGLRACTQNAAATVCDSLSLAKALDFALARDAQVINLSLSGPNDILLSKLIDAALARGVFVVAAFDRAARDGGFPASHTGVVAVNEALAPGRDIPTTTTGGRWGVVNGSSYAAAHVSGLLALVRQRSPSARGASTLVIRKANGTIDACATLLKASELCVCDCGASKDVLAQSASAAGR